MLEKRLTECGRAAWAREEFEQFENRELYKRSVQQRLFKLKGSKKLDGLSLAVLERLVDWRDQWAQQRNRPTRAMMRDDVLVAIAKRRPKRPAELEVLRGFPQSRKLKIVQEVLEVIKKGVATPKPKWPEPFVQPDDSPMTKVAISIFSAYVHAVCHEEGLGHDLVGSTQRLHELLDYLLDKSRPLPLLLTGWRELFIGKRLVDLLEGRCELHLSGWPDDLRLCVTSQPTSD